MNESFRELYSETLDDASKLLLKAAALIEEYGLVKHMLCDGRAYCVRGALMKAGGVQPVIGPGWEGPTWLHAQEKMPTVLEADRRLENAVFSEPPFWNNDPARTKEEVVAKLRTVALGG